MNVGRRSPEKLNKSPEERGCHQSQAISIEKRMPINIFNIKNVNYLKTESRESSQNIFKNEIIRERQGKSKTSTGFYKKKGYNAKLKGKKEGQLQHNSFSRVHRSKEEMEDSQVEQRKRPKSVDAKHLLQMMTQVNHLKNTPNGAKLLFDKIVKSKDQTNNSGDKQFFDGFLQHLESIRKKRPEENRPHNFFMKSEKLSEDKNNTVLKSEITEIPAQEWEFQSKTNKLAKAIQSLMKDFHSQQSKMIKRKVAFQQVQAEEKPPKQLMMANFNTQNLIKEFSRAFMTSKKNVNPRNEAGSDFMNKLEQSYYNKDLQTFLVFKDLFSLEQEHALVEEALKLIQERGFDLEALFLEAYQKLGIEGAIQKQPTQRSDQQDPRDDVSGVTFESVKRPEGSENSVNNGFVLDFQKLDYSE